MFLVGLNIMSVPFSLLNHEFSPYIIFKRSPVSIQIAYPGNQPIPVSETKVASLSLHPGAPVGMPFLSIEGDFLKLCRMAFPIVNTLSPQISTTGHLVHLLLSGVRTTSTL